MKKVIYYYLYYKAGNLGRVIFRLEGEPLNRYIDFHALDFVAVAAVLACKNVQYHIGKKYFVSADNPEFLIPEDLLDENNLVKVD